MFRNSPNPILIPLIFIITLSSCVATHSGSLTGSGSLSSPNFIYIKKDISGQSKVTYILGIGGMKKITLVGNAQKNMLAGNELKSNQALANITVNFKASNYLFVYRTVICTVTADVVEFNK